MRSAALIIAALLSAGRAEAETRSSTISELTDELQQIQTRIAHGDKAAYAAQITQLSAIAAAVAKAGPETWRDKREADSLVVYVLSGGSLTAVAPVIRSDALPKSERTLARGAIAYITSRETDALALLGAIDPDGLDARLAGQVAFARSVLETKRDPKAAVSLLDWARLLAPGGLVEEAALRREIVLLAEAQDAPGAARLARDYAVRFGASLYAPNFFRDLARLIARSGLAKEPADYQLFSRCGFRAGRRRPARFSADPRQGRRSSMDDSTRPPPRRPTPCARRLRTVPNEAPGPALPERGPDLPGRFRLRAGEFERVREARPFGRGSAGGDPGGGGAIPTDAEPGGDRSASSPGG